MRKECPNLESLPPRKRKTTSRERRAIAAGKVLGRASQPDREATSAGEEMEGGTLDPQSLDLSFARATPGDEAQLATVATGTNQYWSAKGSTATPGEASEPHEPLESIF